MSDHGIASTVILPPLSTGAGAADGMAGDLEARPGAQALAASPVPSTARAWRLFSRLSRLRPIAPLSSFPGPPTAAPNRLRARELTPRRCAADRGSRRCVVAGGARPVPSGSTPAHWHADRLRGSYGGGLHPQRELVQGLAAPSTCGPTRGERRPQRKSSSCCRRQTVPIA